MLFSHPVLALSIAACLDYLIGDPKGWIHPVELMGRVIHTYRHTALKQLQNPIALRLAGISLWISLVGGSGLAGWLVIISAKSLHPLAGLGVESIVLASCFAGRSLRDAATDVLRPLTEGNLAEARSTLSQYVGRDTENLSEVDILRAVFETVTENATDGVLAPLFYALVGAAIPDVGGAPLALAYKAASTLDSMVGYRTPPYADLGWFSARLDDILTWLPCRCVVMTIAALSGRPLAVWRICQRDAPADPSPNSGWSECVYAAALNVQVGGMNWYQGIAKPKPLLGDAIEALTPQHITRALRLTRYCFLLWLVSMMGILSWLQSGSTFSIANP